MSRTKLEPVSFEVDARVAIQLGRESISNSIIAIIELVKNAYDADATKVEIIFSNLETTNPTLVIKDNGSGMSLASLKDNWLRIGTKNKTTTHKSKDKERVLTGAKGLGRLGIDRLCKYLVIETKENSDDFICELDIDWSKYENVDADITSIKHDIYKVSVKDSMTYSLRNGTILIMKELKDIWNLEFLNELKKELMLLVSPFSGIGDFSISISTGAFLKEIDGEINSEKFLFASDWVIESELDNKNNVSITMTSSKQSNVYELNNIPWKEFIKSRSDVPNCGPLKFKLYFYLSKVKADEYKEFNFEKKNVREFLSNNCGIRIYRDEFRVKPYGDPDGLGDWLTLQHRKSKEPAGINRPTWKMGHHQSIGAVYISREKNKQLIDQTNREGIVEEVAYYDLRAFCLKVIERFELWRYQDSVSKKQKNEKIEIKSIVENSSDKLSNNLDELETIISNINELSNKTDIGINKLADSKIREIRQSVKEQIENVEKLENYLEQEKNTLSNLASLGILTVSFGHESIEQSDIAAGFAKLLKENFNKGFFELSSPYKEKFIHQLDAIIDSTDFINTFAKFALGNVRFDKRKQKLISLPKILDDVFKAMSNSISEKNIEIDTTGVSKDISKIFAYRIDWESIFINLLTNSVYALKNIIDRERIIRVKMSQVEKNIIIIFADSGIGIEAETGDSIFLPTFSTKRDPKGNNIGTGMGLSIVKTFVEEHSSGIIKVEKCKDLLGAEFIITVPVDRGL